MCINKFRKKKVLIQWTSPPVYKIIILRRNSYSGLGFWIDYLNEKKKKKKKKKKKNYGILFQRHWPC